MDRERCFPSLLFSSPFPSLPFPSLSPHTTSHTPYPSIPSGPTKGSPIHSASFSPPPKLFVLHHRISDVVFRTVDSFTMSAQWIVRPPLLIPWFHREWIGPSLMLGGGSISMEREGGWGVLMVTSDGSERWSRAMITSEASE